jgi:cytochrome c
MTRLRTLLAVAALAVLGFAEASHAQPATAPAALAALPAPYNSANYAAGEHAFAQCAECHAIETGAAPKLGPNLHGVVGRHAGTVSGYDYSQALRDANFAWDAPHLDAWIKDPAGYLPGNDMMADGVSDDSERRDLIAYLMIASR